MAQSKKPRTTWDEKKINVLRKNVKSANTLRDAFEKTALALDTTPSAVSGAYGKYFKKDIESVKDNTTVNANHSIRKPEKVSTGIDIIKSVVNSSDFTEYEKIELVSLLCKLK